MSTFAIPNEKRGTQNLKFGNNKFIEKTDLLYKKQVPRKYNLSRSVNSFEELSLMIYHDRDKASAIFLKGATCW